MTWAPNVPTQEEIEGFVEDLMAITPEILGIDETLPGCEVIDMNPYGVPAGTLPRYIKVAIREYYQDAFYRGGLTGLSVGDYVTVTHLREGNRYEVTGAGGSGGAVGTPPPNPIAQGQALISDAVPEWVASLTPTWLGNHTWGSGFALLPTDATGQDLGDATHRWDLHTQAVYFEGATGNNAITIPDALVDALHVIDTGGTEFLRFDSSNDYLIIDPVPPGAGVGIKTGLGTTTPEAKLDVSFGGVAGTLTVLLGADISSCARTPNATQRAYIGAHHSLAGEEPVGMIHVFSSTILSGLYIGGGTAFFNAPTEVVIYTAPNITTTTGTARLTIDSAGAIIVTGPSLAVPAAWNLIVPDNVANAIRLIDNGAADIFLQIVTTTGSEEIILNAGGDDVDFTVQAVGVADALQVQGSDGQITLGALTAGYVKSSAGGVLSIATEVPLVDLGSYTQGDLIYGGAADWQDLAIGGIGDFLWVNAAGTEPEWHTLVAGDVPAHALLGTRHSDTTTDAPTQGSMIIGNGTPAWDELLHPGDTNHLQTTALAIAWSPNITMGGNQWIGDAGDLRVVFDYANGDLILRLGDAAGADEVQVVDSGGVPVLHIDSDGDVTLVAGITFTGASGVNEITVPDNTAIALEILDAGGLEYLRINSTNANPYFLLDPAAAGINVGVRTTAPVGVLSVIGGEVHIVDATARDLDDAFMTYGLVLNQGAADNEIMSFKSSDVAHGITAQAETDTYGLVRKVSDVAGGMNLVGLTEDTVGFANQAMITNDVTTKTTASSAAIFFSAHKKAGATVGAMGASANLFAIANHNLTKLILSAEADLHLLPPAATASGLKIGSGGVDTAVLTYNTATGENKIGGVQAYVFPTFWAGNQERARILTGGNFGIGTTTPPSLCSVDGDLALVDGMAAPGTTAGWAKIYVDAADGDLKVKFGDGFVAVIAADS